MIPVNRGLTIYQGDTFSKSFRLRVPGSNPVQYVDLSAATGRGQIRTDEASTTVLAEFNVTTAVDGTVTFSLTDEQTSVLTTGGKYDIELTFSNGDVKTYLAGKVKIVPEVTRG